MATTAERCLREALEASGHTFSESDVKRLMDDLNARLKRAELNRKAANSRVDVEDLTREFADEEAQRLAREYRNKFLILQAKLRILNYVEKNWSDNPWDGYAAFLVGANLARSGARLSVDADAKALLAQNAAALDNDLFALGKNDRDANIYDIARTGEMDKDVYVALYDLYQGDTELAGIPDEAKKIAKVYFDTQERLRAQINHHGAWQSKHPSHIAAQTHDPWKLQRALYYITNDRKNRRIVDQEQNFRAWHDFVRPLLDDEETFKYTPDGKEEDFLRQVYINLVSGNHLAFESPYDVQGGGHPSRAERLSRPRVLHFADGESRYKYDRMFARGRTLAERMLFHAEQRGRDIALLRSMGPNPRNMHDQIVNALKRMGPNTIEGRSRSGGEASGRFISRANAYFEQVNGDANIPGRGIVAGTLRNARVIQSISKLGMAVITSFGDTITSSSTLQYNGVNLLQAYGSQVQSLYEGVGSNYERRLVAQHIGTMTDSLRTGLHSRFGSTDYLPGQMASLVHTFFKWSGLSWYTDTLRMGAARTLSLNLGNHAHIAHAELPNAIKRVLKLYGIGRMEWDVARSHMMRDMADGRFFIPEQARDIPNADLDVLIVAAGHTVTARRRRDAREGLERKFLLYLSNQANDAVIHPNARVEATVDGSYVPGLGQMTNGAVGREVAKAINQFKSYPIAVIDQQLGRMRYGYQENADFRTFIWNGQAIPALAQFIVMSAAIGYLSLVTKDILKGRTPRHFWMRNEEGETRALSIMAEALLQGGGLGFYGDFFIPVNARDRWGQSALSNFLGPTFQTTSQIYSLYAGSASDLPSLYSEGNKKAAQAFRILQNNTPFANIWWLKAALDYAIFMRVQENLSPGSLSRIERTLKKEIGQEYIFPPSEVFAR